MAEKRDTFESLILVVAERATKAIATIVCRALNDARREPARGAGRRPATQKPSRHLPASRKPHPCRSYTDADIEGVLSVIPSKPGLRSEQIKAEIGGDDRAVEKILIRLREHGRVVTTGIKRAMTYA